MKSQRKIILAGLIGNLVEAYDISICGYMSVYISRYLLDQQHRSVTAVFAIFFIAYIARPIGALFLGTASDIYGRKNIMMLSIILMGLSTTMIAIIPTHESVGIYAIAILLALRIIQSLAYGSEFLNSASYLVESGDDKKKGFRGSFTSIGVMSGALIASIVTEIFNYYVTPINEYWLWRVPFAIAGFTTIVGFYIRYSIPEGLQYVLYYSNKDKPNTKQLLKTTAQFLKSKPFLIYFAFITSFLNVGTTFLLYIYIPTIHVSLVHNLTSSQVFFGNTVSLILLIVLIPMFGSILDKYDRLKIIQLATLGLVIVIYPFLYTLNYCSYKMFVIMQLITAIPTACFFSVASVLLTDLFPIHIRCTVLSLTYSVAASLAAGLIPLLAMTLVKETHILTSPAWIVLILGFIAMFNFSLLNKNYRQEKNQYISTDMTLAT